jgi:spermidine synthase
VTPPLAFVLLWFAAVIGLVRELGIVLASAYLEPHLPLWTCLFALIAGGVGAHRLRFGRRQLPWLAFALAVVVASSAPVAFHGFGHSAPMALLLVAFSLVAGGLAGAALVAAWSFVGRTLLALEAFAHLLNPFRLLGFALACAFAAGISSMVGSLRTTAALGIVFATLGFWCAPLHAFLERRRLGADRQVRVVGAVLIFCQLPLFVVYEELLPSAELGQLGNPVVYREKGVSQRFSVTSGQDALEIWVDGRLAVSSIDEARYAEAIVHPALTLAKARRRVLVLGSGLGTIEREILKYDDVETVTLVVLDRRSVDLGRRLSWLAERSKGALSSPKIHVVEAEAAVWLDETSEVFDVAIVDLPDPHGYVEVKSYTRWFYSTLRERLTPDGLAVVQATSVFSTPRTFDSIRLTLGAAGFSTLAYHAPIPTMGDWGFVLAHKQSAPPREALARVAPLLSGANADELARLPRDSHRTQPGLVSSLDDPAVLEVFEDEHPSN